MGGGFFIQPRSLSRRDYDASKVLNNAIIIVQNSDRLVETKSCAPHEDATFTADHAGQAALTPRKISFRGEGARHTNRNFGSPEEDCFSLGWRFVMLRPVLGKYCC
jgi:hypothetical protein